MGSYFALVVSEAFGIFMRYFNRQRLFKYSVRTFLNIYIFVSRLGSSLSRLEDKSLRVWLSVIALVEAVQIVRFLCMDAKLEIFFARLGKDRSAKQIVSLLLALLMFNRIHTARHLHLPGVLANCAMVHTAEACFFGFEFYKRFDELKNNKILMVCTQHLMLCAWQGPRKMLALQSSS